MSTMKISLEGPLPVRPPYLRDAVRVAAQGARYTMAFRLCWTTVAFVLPLGVAPRHFMSVVHMSAMLERGTGGRRERGNRGTREGDRGGCVGRGSMLFVLC